MNKDLPKPKQCPRCLVEIWLGHRCKCPSLKEPNDG